MGREGEALPKNSESGFGLVEVVVSMLVLAVLALALLPLLIQGLKVTAANATMATATQLVDSAMDAASTVSACNSLVTGATPSSDARGNALTVVKTRSTCPTSFPATVSYSVTVTRDDTGATIARASTFIFVTGL